MPADRSASFQIRVRCTRRIHLLVPPEALEAPEGQWVEPEDHRKDESVAMVERLLESMALEVLAYAVMGNPLHIVLRSHREATDSWTDLEMIERWVQLHPPRDKRDRRRETLPGELVVLAEDTECVARNRGKLQCISRFM